MLLLDKCSFKIRIAEDIAILKINVTTKKLRVKTTRRDRGPHYTHGEAKKMSPQCENHFTKIDVGRL